MKKILFTIISVIMAVTLSFQFTACKKDKPSSQSSEIQEDQSGNDKETYITLNSLNVELQGVGDSFQLVLTEDGKEITNDVVWSSKNPQVATCENGLCKATSKGSTVVCAVYKDVEYRATVVVNSDFGIELKNDEITQKTFTTGSDSDNFKTIEMVANDKLKLEYKYVKELATDSEKVNFYSSDESVVKVSKNGEITALSDGISVVTIETEQKKLMDVVVGMGSEKQEVTAKDSVVVFVGEDKTNANLKEFFKELHVADSGYSFYGEYHWKGFEQKPVGSEDEENTMWKKENLVNYKGGLILELYKDGTFVEGGTDRLPRSGYIENVDESLPESTIGEAFIKYGDAYRYPASMFTQVGVMKFYGDDLYLIMTESNAKVDVDGKIKKLGKKDLEVVKNHSPFEFMNDLYDGLNYTMEKTIIGYSIDKAEIKITTAGNTEKLTLKNGENKVTKGVSWSSENQDVATVDQDGVVTAVATGSTVITALYKGTKYRSIVNVDASYDILITNENVKSVLLKGSEEEKDQASYLFLNVEKNKPVKLTYNIKKQNISNGNEVTFASSDDSVAIIDSNGEINAKSEGMCVISITSKEEIIMEQSMGMDGDQLVKGHFVKEIILTCGKEGNLNDFLNGKNGYKYTGTFNFKGFEKDISKNDPKDKNTLWSKENLTDYTGDISIEINKNGTFVEQLGNVPRAGFIGSVDESLPETTVEEALIKYGNAYRYKGTMFKSKGVVKVYGENVYLIYVNKMATSKLSERVVKISSVSGETVKGYSPFEFMTKFYEELKYDLQREDIA